MLETLEIGAAGETPAARLSVIIPSFNCGHLLQRSVRSAFAISTPGLEVIVIDDGSTDNTQELCTQLCATYPSLRVIRQRNSGQSVARNVGLAACSGEFIILLDADDELLPFDPQLIFDFNVDVLRIAIDDTALDGQAFIDADSVPTLKGNVYLHSRLTGRGFRVESWAYVYRRSYLMARSLRFPVGLIHEDVLFTVEALLYAGSVAGTDVPMYRYIRRPGSTMGTHSYDISRHRLRCFRVIFKSVLGLANTHRDVDLWLWAEHVLNVAWRYACQEKSRRMAWTVLRMEYDFFTGYRLWGVYRTRLQARYRLRQGLEQLLWGPVERHPGREARPSRG